MDEREMIDALKMKDDVQREVQERLEGCSPAEALAKIREMAEQGPLGDWWAKAKASQRSRRCA